MSTGTAAPEKETAPSIVTSVFAVVMGSVVVLAGSIVLFAASPTILVDPVFEMSSWESVSVVANMILGASIGTVGFAVAVPQLDRLLETSSL